MKYSNLTLVGFTLAGALLVHDVEQSRIHESCRDVSPTGVRVCQQEVILPQHFHTVSSTVAIEVLTSDTHRVYTLVSGEITSGPPVRLIDPEPMATDGVIEVDLG